MQSALLQDDVDFLSAAYFREIEAIDNIVIKFSQELLGDDGDPIVEFNFGCGVDRIEWNDHDFSHMEIAPPVVISLNFEELGKMRFNALTPKGVQGLLFRGRYRRRITEELKPPLRFERKRVAEGG
ncbi:hypothetical protein [Pararhizobium gei]|uniref:hypothetical protein n=1 Tax=Pararhizobium gei TaxID=1395951 RepID=UPI0023DBD638|nr:hypothetical protein [Rhizobium gei]